MNQLFYGDNLGILRDSIPDESVDLVYLDPPFNSNATYNVLFKHHDGASSAAQIEAFDDTWHWNQQTEKLFDEMLGGGATIKVADALSGMKNLLGTSDMMAYVVMMTARLLELHRVLKPTGSIYLHCDPTASHYLKIIMDAVFGPQRFINEVIWQRTATKGDVRLKFGRVHDVLLAYSKSATYTFKSQFLGQEDPDYLERFKFDDGDGRGPYQSAPLDSPSTRANLTYEYKGYQPPTKGWRVNLELMEELDRDGRLIFPKKMNQRIRRKVYLDENEGPKVGDVWTDIPPLQASSAERLGYPTQKPLALLERVIAASSNEGDVVLDPFCGCGTAVDAAQKTRRKWIGIDITFIAVDLIRKRMRSTYGDDIEHTYVVHGVPADIEGAHALFDENPFDFERWAVSLIDGQPNEKQVADKGIDGRVRFYAAKSRIGQAIVSVKGGKTVNPAMMNALSGVVEREKAEMGILISLTKPTRGMLEEARKSGTVRIELTGQEYPKLQIVTVADLMSGKRPKMPAPILPYLKAKARSVDQDTMF